MAGPLAKVCNMSCGVYWRIPLILSCFLAWMASTPSLGALDEVLVFDPAAAVAQSQSKIGQELSDFTFVKEYPG